MPTTTNRGNPYPLNSAAAEVWEDVQALAEALDLVPDIDTGTSFPGSPNTNMLFRRTDEPGDPLYIWTGADWELLTLRQSQGTAVPADIDGVEGERFWDTDDDAEWRHDGSTWQRVTFAAQTALCPPGGIISYGGSTAPSGWLLCDGSVVVRATYADLFAIIGTTYNSGGEAGTDFRLPDLRGRVAVGADNMDNSVGTGGGDAGRLTSANTLGTAGGTETHTLVTAELAAHTHVLTVATATTGVTAVTVSNGAHTHTITVDAGGAHSHTGVLTPDTTRAINTVSGTTYRMDWGSDGASDAASTHTHTASSASNGAHTHTVTVTDAGHLHTATAANAGSGTAHNNMQPFLTLNSIIKT